MSDNMQTRSMSKVEETGEQTIYGKDAGKWQEVSPPRFSPYGSEPRFYTPNTPSTRKEKVKAQAEFHSFSTPSPMVRSNGYFTTPYANNHNPAVHSNGYTTVRGNLVEKNPNQLIKAYYKFPLDSYSDVRIGYMGSVLRFRISDIVDFEEKRKFFTVSDGMNMFPAMSSTVMLSFNHMHAMFRQLNDVINFSRSGSDGLKYFYLNDEITTSFNPLKDPTLYNKTLCPKIVVCDGNVSILTYEGFDYEEREKPPGAGMEYDVGFKPVITGRVNLSEESLKVLNSSIHGILSCACRMSIGLQTNTPTTTGRRVVKAIFELAAESIFKLTSSKMEKLTSLDIELKTDKFLSAYFKSYNEFMSFQYVVNLLKRLNQKLRNSNVDKGNTDCFSLFHQLMADQETLMSYMAEYCIGIATGTSEN